MSRYHTLFQEYVDDLRQAHDEALTWWNALLASAASDGDMAAAEQHIRPRWPAGPVSHPRVIAVYRKYWLEADRINEEVLHRWEQRAEARNGSEGEWGVQEEQEEEGVVKPSALLTENLIAHHPELYEFIVDMVFQPIGVNYEGEHA